jgi:hypothetical protein
VIASYVPALLAQVKLLSRFTRRIIVSATRTPPDKPPQAFADDSARAKLRCPRAGAPGGKDPDSFIRSEGAAVYIKLLEARAAVPRLLIGRARSWESPRLRKNYEP